MHTNKVKSTLKGRDRNNRDGQNAAGGMQQQNRANLRQQLSYYYNIFYCYCYYLSLFDALTYILKTFFKQEMRGGEC